MEDDQLPPGSEPLSSKSGRVLLACVFEGSLVGVAAGFAWLVGYQLWQNSSWNFNDFFAGVAGALPPLAVIFGLMRAGWLEETRRFLDHFARDFFKGWTLLELAVISGLAGLGEESLFRGVLQGKISLELNLWWGIVVANVLFGAVHCISRQYFVITALMGVYLSILYVWSGNLLTPIVTHALYDFLALIYLVRRQVTPRD